MPTIKITDEQAEKLKNLAPDYLTSATARVAWLIALAMEPDEELEELASFECLGIAKNNGKPKGPMGFQGNG